MQPRWRAWCGAQPFCSSALVFIYPRLVDLTKAKSAEGANAAEQGTGSLVLAKMRKWFKEPLVQALLLASGSAYVFLLHNLTPTFAVDVYNIKVADQGWIITASPLLNVVVCVPGDIDADHQCFKRRWLTHQCRMLIQLLGTAVFAACIVELSMVSDTRVAAVLVTVRFAVHGFQIAGLHASLQHIGKLRASERFSMGNVISRFADILSGLASSRGATTLGWKTVLLVGAARCTVSGAYPVVFVNRSDKCRSHDTTVGQQRGQTS